jgi:type VI secretion system protein ImpM
MGDHESIDTAREIAVYGKLPFAPDYVMVHLTDPVSIALSEWIDRGFQDIAGSGLSFPSTFVRFVFTSNKLPMAAVGVLAPSRDQVGRSFPVAIFHTLPVSVVWDNLGAIPISYAGFMAEVSALITNLSDLNQTEFLARLQALRPPYPEDIARAKDELSQALAETDASDFASRLFGDPEQGKQNYAFNTFMKAALDAARNPSATSPVVLECPVEVDIDLLAWIDLAQKVLGWREHAPSYFWAVEPRPRLLIALGSAPKLVIRYLADAAYASTKLWSLTTDRPDAIANATAELHEFSAAFLSPTNPSLRDLFSALQRHQTL